MNNSWKPKQVLLTGSLSYIRLLSLSEKSIKFMRHVFPLQNLSCLFFILLHITSIGWLKLPLSVKLDLFLYYFSVFWEFIYSCHLCCFLQGYLMCCFITAAPKVFVLYPVVNWISDNNLKFLFFVHIRRFLQYTA